jgi:cytidyltransferase-like protein
VPDFDRDRVALVVGRMQPLHLGHARIIERALAECGLLVLVLGSAQLSGVVRHPFSVEERMGMLHAWLGDRAERVRFVPLKDINSLEDTDEWVDWVLKKIQGMKLRSPTDYYTGSMVDAVWYLNRFADPARDTLVEGGPGQEVSVYASGLTGRRLHILERADAGLPSATELRTLIELRRPEWKAFVPREIIDLVEERYPGHLRVALAGERLPDPVPVEGTAFVLRRGGKATRHVVRDGRWQLSGPARSG